MERKILVALGNTGLDQTTIGYLVELFRGSPGVKLHLLNIVPLHGVAESQQLLGDLETTAAARPEAVKKRFAALSHLQGLKKKLLAAGFKDEQIQTESLYSYCGVSGPLLRQAQTGAYDAIVLGKRDLSVLEKMISGSISSELWQKDHSIPLWLVSGHPRNRNFLVPVDCTVHSLRAVDHLGFILQGDPQAEITLFHSSSLLAAETITPREKFHACWGKEWCDRYLQGDGDGHFHFTAAEQILKESGIPAAHLKRLFLDSGIEPAQVIVREVKKRTYGTLVMGRRQDKEKNIFKGVSDRVLANVRDVAVWIIG